MILYLWCAQFRMNVFIILFEHIHIQGIIVHRNTCITIALSFLYLGSRMRRPLLKACHRPTPDKSGRNEQSNQLYIM